MNKTELKKGIYKFQFHHRFTYSPQERLFRLIVFKWNVGVPGDGKGHSNKLSFAISPYFFKFDKELWGWCLTLLFLRIHKKRAWGGIF